jgi:glycosyltransferase involved in cell wall biosynthesis
MHPTIPFTIQKYSSTSLKAKMQAWMQDRSYDYTIIDGLHGAAFIDFENPGFGKFIYRAHNVENELWRQLAAQEGHPLKKAVLEFEYGLSKRFEKRVCEKSIMTFTVSDLDSDKFAKLLPTARFHSLPIGAAIEKEPLAVSAASETLRLLFVGRLDWEPNKKGLEWFLNQVWPSLVQRRSVQLTIIGSGDSAWLQKYQSGNVRLLSNVPTLKEYYQDCHLTLIPLFMGSGTRVKAIESGNFGRSFVATRIGVEGLPYQAARDYLAAETVEEWLNLLTSFDVHQAGSFGKTIHAVTQKHFEKRALAVNLLSHLQTSPTPLHLRKEHNEIHSS